MEAGNSLESFAGYGLNDNPENRVFFASKKLVYIYIAACALALAYSRPACCSVSGVLSVIMPATFEVMFDGQRSETDIPILGLLGIFGDSKIFLGEFWLLKGSYYWTLNWFFTSFFPLKDGDSAGIYSFLHSLIALANYASTCPPGPPKETVG